MGSLKKGLRNAFAVDPPGPAQPTPEQQGPVDWICRQIARRHLTVPGVMFAEVMRPLNYVGAQAMHVFAPAVWALFKEQGYDEYRHLTAFLEQRGSIEYMINRIEELEAEYEECEREARAAAKRERPAAPTPASFEEDHDQD